MVSEIRADWLNRNRSNNRNRGRDFTITKASLIEIAERQDYRCFMTNLRFVPWIEVTRGMRHPFSPSVDRIDPAKGTRPKMFGLVA